MPYRYLPDIAIADAAFEAWGETIEEVFTAASEAVMNVMVGDLETIEDRERRTMKLQDADLDMLLFQLLQELVFYKDAERLLLRIKDIEIRRQEDGYLLTASAGGEEVSPGRHELGVDVKAVTLHRFSLERTLRGWEATVIIDI